jgi:hypothetical protein
LTVKQFTGIAAKRKPRKEISPQIVGAQMKVGKC